MNHLKTPYYRSKPLLALARGKPCLLQAVAGCRGADGTTTVAAHSNQSKHGKGAHIKAHDTYTVWACAVCHTWLDSSYSATQEEKFEAFDEACYRQLREWIDLAEGGCKISTKAVDWRLDNV
jgi:Protein of unknown function (DUF1364)